MKTIEKVWGNSEVLHCKPLLAAQDHVIDFPILPNFCLHFAKKNTDIIFFS